MLFRSDIYPDSLEVNLRQVNRLFRGLLKLLLNMGAAAIVDATAKRISKTSPVAEWGLEEGMHVTGTSSPYRYLRKISEFNTADVSKLIKQDVLLLAGNEDHLIPMGHLYRQIDMLKNARSITTRVFTKNESASAHCQVGNYGLALRTIVSWLDEMTERAAAS